MQCIPKNKLLEYPSDTLQYIRKENNLDRPGIIEDAISILRHWVQKQPHFKKKDFSDTYLEIMIYTCKGSLERAKKQIDRMCTVRTLLPQFFQVRNPKTDYWPLFEVFYPVFLPKLTPDYYRVFLLKSNNNAHLIKDYMNYFTYAIMLCDYIKLHDFCNGYIIIFDFMEMNVMDFLTNVNPVHLKQATTITVEAYGLRVKGIHLFTPSKLIDTVVKLLKQVVNPKISDRIHAHKNLEQLPSVVPINILPEEYGGKEKSLKLLSDTWIDVLSSDENLNYLRDLQQAATDETYRQDDKFNEEYAGMSGTFRVLSID